jgi:hypothetical protein
MDEMAMAIVRFTIYATAFGWRYRAGKRDDGNYASAGDALFAAQNWCKSHPDDGHGD